ncbi:sulfite exporter TauE/SafE family protein [Mesorhizobium xinjiangense]|uniref:sulfite exporter TauE/SafE family protein n=1 Tax=Mesorhizobium xinjiangense TaxID=2678685 RepID=UPI0012ED9BB9|nr:sulfite exporter TauE/SafE family protein [Mesorhizobium xinjiangense]
MDAVITDPVFYLAAVPAVILVGLAKGGLGGAMGFLGVPLMALVISPVQAAAILLPILVVMDIVSLWSWRGYFNRQVLAIMLPGALVGIALGWLTAALVTADAVRLILGLVTILFVLRWLMQKFARSEGSASPRTGLGLLWGAVSGFTSFVAHAGGPPYQVYTLPLRMEPKIFVGTSVIFFAVVNAVKLVPYFALGQFSTVNLATSAALLPLAPLATLSDAFVVKRMRAEIFYLLTYATVLIVAIKLVWDGAAAFG